MGKKTFGRYGPKPPQFRESDFAGRPPPEQAKLSGSLNYLSEQLAASRKLLQEMEARPARFGALISAPVAAKPIDDGDAPA